MKLSSEDLFIASPVIESSLSNDGKVESHSMTRTSSRRRKRENGNRQENTKAKKMVVEDAVPGMLSDGKSLLEESEAMQEKRSKLADSLVVQARSIMEPLIEQVND